MFGLVELMQAPEMQDPELTSIEAYQTFEEAQNRVNVLQNKFLEEYGEDYYERISAAKPMAVASNGDVVWWVYIKKFANP